MLMLLDLGVGGQALARGGGRGAGAGMACSDGGGFQSEAWHKVPEPSKGASGYEWV